MLAAKRSQSKTVDWQAVVRELGPSFAERAADNDETDAFVAQNYRDLKTRRILSAGVPLELGGGGATYAKLCAPQ